MILLKYSNLKIITLLCFVFIINNSHGQNNSDDRIKKITLLSAAVPGLGQIYNKKYWKAPIIYAGLSGTAYYYIYNNNKYKEYKSAYIAETDDNQNTINSSGYNTANLITLQDYYRDSRDLSAFLFLVVYCLNIIDSSVDAHLTNYNLNDNLSLYLKSDNRDNIETINVCLKLNL